MQFERHVLPEFLKYNDIIYVPNSIVDFSKVENCDIFDFVSLVKKLGKKTIVCNVLPKQLRNTLDCNGIPHKPTQYIFVSK